MGKSSGFLEYSRIENHTAAPAARIQNFNEFHNALSEDERRCQGARCMNCGVPMCQSALRLKGMVTGCPLHNLIPEWNDEVYLGHPEHALSRLLKTASFPEFTGRVCPALCEKACVCGMPQIAGIAENSSSDATGKAAAADHGELPADHLLGTPVTVHDNELYIIEYAFAHGLMKPQLPPVRSGKKVAVIGSGPAGLAAAQRLNHRGHSVTVYERDDRIGGLLMYGIPNMKLQKEVIFRRQHLLEEEGITFVTNTEIGPDSAGLLSQYDAVVLSCGAKKPRALGVPGFDTTYGVHFAVDFLKSTTKAIWDYLESASSDPEALSASGTGKAVPAKKPSVLTCSEIPAALLDRLPKGSFLSAKDKHVVIVGGGDTGNDCVGACIRHGCKSVTQLEMMPQPPIVRAADNPWPEWPKVLKTDYGQQEAIALFGHDPRIYETTVKELITNKKGQLKSIKTVKVRFEGRQMIELEGSEKILPCDLLLIAAGFTGCETTVPEALGLQLTGRGVVATEDGHYRAKAAQTFPAIFTAGDMHRGQSLVVWAIVEGRECAREVDEYLMGYTNLI